MYILLTMSFSTSSSVPVLLFNVSMKVFDFSVQLMNRCIYLEVYHLLAYYFSKLSSLLLSGRPVQANHYNFKRDG